MPYQLKDISEAVRKDPRAFLADCDRQYQEKISQAADIIIENLEKSVI